MWAFKAAFNWKKKRNQFHKHIKLFVSHICPPNLTLSLRSSLLICQDHKIKNIYVTGKILGTAAFLLLSKISSPQNKSDRIFPSDNFSKYYGLKWRKEESVHKNPYLFHFLLWQVRPSQTERWEWPLLGWATVSPSPSRRFPSAILVSSRIPRIHFPWCLLRPR